MSKQGRRDFLKIGALGLAGGAVATSMINAEKAAAQAPEDSVLRRVLKRGHLLVGTGSTNPPWHFKNEQGEMDGVDIMIGKAIAFHIFDEDGHVEFVITDPAARIPNIVTNKVDCVVQFMTITGPRAQMVNFSRPYFLNAVSLLTGPKSRYKTKEELLAAGPKARASILQNVDAMQIAREALPEAEILQVDTQANVIQAVDSGHVDAGYMSVSQVRWLITQKPGRYYDTGAYFRPNSFAVAVKLGDPDWLNFVNVALTNTMWGSHSKVFDEAYKKFLGLPTPERKAGFPYFSH
jgi:polar amino acid transport system substrate-binding protein